MFRKGSKPYSILKNKCPRCHEGAFFKYPVSFNFNKVTRLHDTCSKCGLKYMMEPSFFFGAMYVNYGLAVGLFVGVFIIAKLLFGMSILHSFISIIIVSIILTPVTLRLSRIIWINLFIHYTKNSTTKNVEK